MAPMKTGPPRRLHAMTAPASRDATSPAIARSPPLTPDQPRRKSAAAPSRTAATTSVVATIGQPTAAEPW